MKLKLTTLFSIFLSLGLAVMVLWPQPERTVNMEKSITPKNSVMKSSPEELNSKIKPTERAKVVLPPPPSLSTLSSPPTEELITPLVPLPESKKLPKSTLSKKILEKSLVVKPQNPDFQFVQPLRAREKLNISNVFKPLQPSEEYRDEGVNKTGHPSTSVMNKNQKTSDKTIKTKTTKEQETQRNNYSKGHLNNLESEGISGRSQGSGIGKIESANIQTVSVATLSKGRALLRVLEHGSGPEINFAWPDTPDLRNKLFRIFHKCYGMEVALMGKDKFLYRFSGSSGRPSEINMDIMSGFVRMIGGRISEGEAKHIGNLRKRYPLVAKAEAVRLFPRDFDGGLLGGLFLFKEKKNAPIKSISARYKLYGSKVYMGDIRINGQPVEGKIDLSPFSFCKKEEKQA